MKFSYIHTIHVVLYIFISSFLSGTTNTYNDMISLGVMVAYDFAPYRWMLTHHHHIKH